MTQPNELEWLGLELALARHFVDTPTQAAILARLVRRAGLTVRREALVDGLRVGDQSLTPIISTLRACLSHLGFSFKVESVSGCGYRISPSGAAEVWGRVRTLLTHIDDLPDERAAA
jgi:DNA-binding response OmpR family regulator